MKFKIHGGHNLRLSGRPTSDLEEAAMPETLLLPLSTKRISFSELCVEDGAQVRYGDILARNPDHAGAVLPAPARGSVSFGHDGHISLRPDRQPSSSRSLKDEEETHSQSESDRMDWEGMTEMLCRYGVWPFFSDVHSGTLPEPDVKPGGIIVSTVNLDPFVARGSVMLRNSLARFARGLRHLQVFLDYQPIHLLVPAVDSDLAAELHETVRGQAWLRTVELEMLYPSGNQKVAAMELGLGAAPESAAPIWGLNTAGVLAVDDAVTWRKPAAERILSIGGPVSEKPRHLKAPLGYPLRELIGDAPDDSELRIINGGVLTGIEVNAQSGIDSECSGITVLENHKEREFLGFLRPGADRSSYSRAFLSSLRDPGKENLITALRGDPRPCILCGLCGRICPARIMPYLIHKHHYADDLDGVERARVDRCVGCGLCSYCCPSKIELTSELIALQQQLREEKAALETTT